MLSAGFVTYEIVKTDRFLKRHLQTDQNQQHPEDTGKCKDRPYMYLSEDKQKICVGLPIPTER